MRNRVTSILVFALGTLASTGNANADGLSGVWSGGGAIQLTKGGVEKVRCRISYSKSTGRTFLMSVKCAHRNGAFRQTGRVVEKSRNRFTGRMYSDEHSVSGDIVISVKSTTQTLSVKSSKGSGSLSLSKD